jgi:hypothetical protein
MKEILEPSAHLQVSSVIVIFYVIERYEADTFLSWHCVVYKKNHSLVGAVMVSFFS